MSLTDEFRVGTEVHGFAGGVFGRDSYGCRRIEAMGSDWVVTRMLEAPREPEFVSGSESLHWLKDAIANPPSDCMCLPYDPDR